jgi:hypothetical protein
MIIMITPRTTILKLFVDLDVAGKQAAEEWIYIKISILSKSCHGGRYRHCTAAALAT